MHALWQILLYLGRPATPTLYLICGAILVPVYGVWLTLMAKERYGVPVGGSGQRTVPDNVVPLARPKVIPVAAPAGKARSHG